MPAGLQVFNDIGTAQITGEEVSLSLVNKFALTLTRRYTSGQQLYYAVNLTIPLDCVLLMGDTSGAYVNVWIDPSSNGTYAQLTSHAGVTVMLYLFAGAPIIASKSGMQVFGADGRLLFDASHKILRPIYANTMVATEYLLPVGNGRVYAAALTYSRVHFYSEYNDNIDGTTYDSTSIGRGYVRRGALMDINFWGDNLFRFFDYNEVTPLKLTPPTLLVADVTFF